MNDKTTHKKKPTIIFEIVDDSPKNITLKTSALKGHSRCKKGTKKYNKLGTGCYTNEEIDNYRKLKPKSRKNKKSEDPEKRIEIKQKSLLKRHLKTPIEVKIMEEPKRYNEQFIEIMEKLNAIMLKQGEPFRARAYQKAQETIMTYPDNITSPSQLKGLPNIGSTIMDKLEEYVSTGTLRILEREKTNPINILADIYGVGPKKAKELVDAGITTIAELRARQNELLNDIQKVGLRYYEQIQERIPRSEIEEYDVLFHEVFAKVSEPNAKFEIVGSYRRGAKTSGDIDVIITGDSGSVYTKFVNNLLQSGIIVEILSRGSSKTLVIARLPGSNRIARRIDFLYAPPNEFAFAILYFTGSKIFNTVMRQYGLNQGYTFNEHGIYKLENKKKGDRIAETFATEKDIFDFLGLQYKTPVERVDGRAVIKKDTALEEEVFEIVPVKKQKTLKNRKETAKKEPAPPAIKAQAPPATSQPAEPVILPLIERFKHTGISILEDLNETQLMDIIRIANQKYYNQTQIMTDNQYDIVKEFMEHKYPNNAVLSEIGAEVEQNKVELPYEMPSMDKIKPDTNILPKWTAKYTGPYVISCKLDGVSGLYTTTGATPKLYTRGNGTYGQDISHLIPHLRLPKTKGIVIRGEIIIPKQLFEQKYKTMFANPRSMATGIVIHKHISEYITDVRFVAYEVINPELIPSAQMVYLEMLNVESVLYQSTNTLSNEMLSSVLVDWRNTYAYEIDGIIVSDDKMYPRKSKNPDHAFAFKMVLSDQIAEAIVVDVIWTPSKDGYLKPRVQFEPIHLGGVTITFATGFNGAFIKNNNIGIGTTIELIRSGDVIPYIKSVIVPSEEPKMPSVPYKWNDTHVDVMLENVSEDPTVKEKNITGFFRGIGVEGLSSGNVTRIINAGFTTVPDIIGMTEEDFLTVDGFKGKLANKIYTGIKQKLSEASIVTLMSSSNIFGRGFSDTKMNIVFSELPDILVSSATDEEKIKLVSSVKGMGTKSAEAFISNIDAFKEFLMECGLGYKLEVPVKEAEAVVDATHALFGKTVVLTGTRDKNIIEFLKNVGAKQGASVNKNTHLVVAKNKDDDTGKAEEARKLAVPIMSVDEFIKTYL